jgi:rhodanese-related sulfurtransferase
MSDQMTFQQKGLFQQGYQEYSPAQLKQLEWGLRFTPFVCSAITAYGLFTAQPAVLFAVSLLGIWAFLAPAAHPMDLIYNHAVRHLIGAVALPENPFQRRLACLAAGVMNFAAALLFLFELPTAALAVGIALLVLQAIVITTHFCTLSWMYEGIMRALGKWKAPIDFDEAEALLVAGAKLIDVRSPTEFAQGAIAGAVNLPMEQLDAHLDDLRDSQYLLYCASGARSQIATEKLRASGLNNVYDLGSKSRAAALLRQEP